MAAGGCEVHAGGAGTAWPPGAQVHAVGVGTAWPPGAQIHAREVGTAWPRGAEASGCAVRAETGDPLVGVGCMAHTGRGQAGKAEAAGPWGPLVAEEVEGTVNTEHAAEVLAVAAGPWGPLVAQEEASTLDIGQGGAPEAGMRRPLVAGEGAGTLDTEHRAVQAASGLPLRQESDGLSSAPRVSHTLQTCKQLPYSNHPAVSSGAAKCA